MKLRPDLVIEIREVAESRKVTQAEAAKRPTAMLVCYLPTRDRTFSIGISMTHSPIEQRTNLWRSYKPTAASSMAWATTPPRPGDLAPLRGALSLGKSVRHSANAG